MTTKRRKPEPDQDRIGRRATTVMCGRCRRLVWAGLDREFGGFATEADPQPLSAWGEALALIGGRATVELRWLGNRYEIDRRDYFRIRGSPAGTPGMDVLVVHDCDRDYGGAIPHIASNLRRLPAPVSDSDKPPF